MEKPFWSALKIPLHHYYCYYVHYMWFLVWYKENKFECHAALRSLFILILRPLTLVLEKKSFYNFPLSSLRHGVFKRKNKISFQHYIHNGRYINCYYVHYAVIVTEKYIFSFQHYCVRYTMMKKIYLSPIVNCYYPTASWLCQKNIFPITTTFTTPWSWQKYVFISALCVLHLDHDKKHALLIQFYTL